MKESLRSSDSITNEDLIAALDTKLRLKSIRNPDLKRECGNRVRLQTLHDRRMFSEIYDSTFFSTNSTFIEIELNKRRTDSTCPGNDSIISGKDSTFPGMAFNYFSW